MKSTHFFLTVFLTKVIVIDYNCSEKQVPNNLIF